MKLIVLSVLLAAAVAHPSGKITGGQTAELGQFPWQASLQQNGFHFCGGSLIDDLWVMTAAHCIQGSGWTATEVVLADWDIYNDDGTEVRIEPELVIPHPEYADIGRDWKIPHPSVIKNLKQNRIVVNDIALIKLSSSALGNEHVDTIALPSSQNQESTGMTVTSGWGADNTGAAQQFLQYVEYPVVNDATCQFYFGDLVKEHNICVGDQEPGKSVCPGDSGGPLVCSDDGDYVCGVTSWIGYYSECGDGPFPNVFTQTSYFLDWIQETMASN